MTSQEATDYSNPAHHRDCADALQSLKGASRVVQLISTLTGVATDRLAGLESCHESAARVQADLAAHQLQDLKQQLAYQAICPAAL